MSIWFILWLVLSAALLYFLGWTLYILYRQKQGWKKYAAAKKLRYSSARMLAAPEMSGIIDDYTISFFTGEHMGADGRSTRRLTAIEVSLSSRMPFEGSIASGGMVPLVRNLGMKEEFLPAQADWEKTWIAATSSHSGLETYLTPERLEALTSLMKVKNTWVIFIFRDDVMLLRLDTPDALDDPKKIDLLVKKMTGAARMLELKSGEDSSLKAVAGRPGRKVAVSTATKISPAVGGLELESDDTP